MNEINLSEKRELIQKIGKELFDRITNLPKEVRPDNTPRTGIQIVARELCTRNLVMESIYEPSEAARFFAVEKTVRTQCLVHVTSQDSEDPECMQFAGSVSYYNEDDCKEFHVSVSGLKAEEDVTIAIIILSQILEKTIDEVIKNIGEAGTYQKACCGGHLPTQWADKNHYLNAVLNEYK